jgi:triosephosphate isomerase
MRKKIVAGNWKMNQNLNEGIALINSITSQLSDLNENNQVIFATPYIHLSQAVQAVQQIPFVSIAAQNCHQENNGAYTGEIAPGMLSDLNVGSVLIGHSERRQYNHESNELLAKKVNAALAKQLQVIFCCGESLDIRDANTQNEFVAQQLKESLFHLSASDMANIVIAYEPIWAIGTGRTASAEQAQDMHQHIRQVIHQQYGASVAEQMTILYGGSCKASNAAELFAGADVDGGLIGGASLIAEDFLGIIDAMKKS